MWIWVVDFRLWIRIQPCYLMSLTCNECNGTPNTYSMHKMSHEAGATKKQRPTLNRYEGYLLNEFLAIFFVGRTIRFVDTVVASFLRSKFAEHSQFGQLQCTSMAYITAKSAIDTRWKCLTIYYPIDLMHFLPTAKSIWPGEKRQWKYFHFNTRFIQSTEQPNPWTKRNNFPSSN